MKETKLHETERIENIKPVEIQKKQKWVGTLLPHKNHKVFEYNTVTTEMRLAEFETTIADYTKKDGGSRRQIIQKENCRYIPALNLKNAFKKIGIKVEILKKKK